jgi:hypothetical protein
MKKEVTYNSVDGRKTPVTVKVGSYEGNKSLFVGAECETEDDDGIFIEPFKDFTVDLGFTLPPFIGAIKTYSEGEDVLDFLEDNELGCLTGAKLTNGFVTMLLFEFDRDRLAEFDPEGVRMYEKSIKNLKGHKYRLWL